MERKIFFGQISDNSGVAETHLHVRDRYDDGKLTPRTIREKQKEHDVDIVCITPHNDFDLARRVVGELEDQGLTDSAIAGEEVTAVYTTESGEVKDRHIIGLFLSEQIPSGNHPFAVVEEILRQDGVVIIPHSGNGDARVASMTYCEIEELFKRYPQVRFGIEIYNASIRDAGKLKRITHINDTNSQVRGFYLDHQEHLFPTGGTDAHFRELGFGVTIFEGKGIKDLRNAMEEGKTSVAYIDRMQSRNPLDFGGHKAAEISRKIYRGVGGMYGRSK